MYHSSSHIQGRASARARYTFIGTTDHLVHVSAPYKYYTGLTTRSIQEYNTALHAWLSHGCHNSSTRALATRYSNKMACKSSKKAAAAKPKPKPKPKPTGRGLSQFYYTQSVIKNQLLNKNIEKVMAILVDWKRHELQYSGGCQWGEVGWKSYRTVRLGAPAKLKNLHSKIGRRVDFARVRYGTMQRSLSLCDHARIRPPCARRVCYGIRSPLKNIRARGLIIFLCFPRAACARAENQAKQQCHFKRSRWCMDPLGTDSCRGTVPMEPPMSNESMHHCTIGNLKVKSMIRVISSGQGASCINTIAMIACIYFKIYVSTARCQPAVRSRRAARERAGLCD
jgi:hypothetical protein